MKLRPLSALITGMLAIPATFALASASEAATPATASLNGFLYSGDAYGTYVTDGSAVLSGKSAVTTMCTSFGDSGHGTGMAGVDVPNVITTGVVSASAFTSSTDTTVAAIMNSTAQDASLLSGLITATNLKSVSTTSYDGTRFHTRAGGSRFGGLVVDGTPITTHPAANTVIMLPDVGRVVVNEQISQIGATSASLTVNVLHVYVTHRQPGVSKGTQIVVAHTTSTLAGDQAGGLGGETFGTWANAPSHVISGRTARVFMGCGGTGGVLKTNSVAGVDAAPVITTGTVTDTAQGTITAASADGETTASAETVNLLDGLVTADSARADAHATKTADQVTLSDAGTTFANLVVDGNAIASDVAPNTKIVVGNVAIWLHRVITSDNSIEVRAIEVVATGANPYDLEIGTRVQVAVTQVEAL